MNEIYRGLYSASICLKNEIRKKQTDTTFQEISIKFVTICREISRAICFLGVSYNDVDEADLEIENFFKQALSLNIAILLFGIRTLDKYDFDGGLENTF